MGDEAGTVARTYSEELVYTSSEDGLLLEGAVMRPAGVPLQPVGVVWIHGNAARFYDYPYIAIGRALAASGYAFVSGNTRGHDISAFVWRAAGGRPTPWRSPGDMPTGGGSAWERLDEAPRDLAAWVEVAAGPGSGGVVLAGHSSGAQKVVLYQAERQDPRVRGLVLASPDLRGFWPPGVLEEARRLVAEGRGMDALPAQPYAPWYLQGAQSVMSRAAVLAHLLVAETGEPAIASIRCPVLAFFGTREHGGAGELDTVRRQARAASRVDTHLVGDADHVYTGHEPEVAGVIARWAATLA
jgi:alpha-beta hydrolase superfamily lysophospholipase